MKRMTWEAHLRQRPRQRQRGKTWGCEQRSQELEVFQLRGIPEMQRPFKEGFLLQHRAANDGWERLWCVLRPGLLETFTEPQMTQRVARLALGPGGSATSFEAARETGAKLSFALEARPTYTGA